MSNENEAEKPSEEKPAAEAPKPAPAAGGAHPHELLGAGSAAVAAKDPFYARHEGAHAVTIDDNGWVVSEVNLNARQTKADLKEFFDAVKRTNWSNTVQRETMKPRVRDYVTTVVAGYLAENLVGSPEQRISQRLDEKPWLLELVPERIDADRDRVRYFLQLVQCSTLDEVIAAEHRAEEILTRRRVHYDALVALLLDKRVVAREDLEIALGKKPPREETAR
jgi:hypothetical protein